MIVSIIAAAAENNVIGHSGKLPWGLNLKSDLKHFKETTAGHIVIMGRKTFESIGRALPNRTNVVVSRNKNFTAPDCSVVENLEKALDIARGQNESEAFIIGGQSLFEESIKVATKIYLTRVRGKFDGDTHFPALGPEWEKIFEDRHQKDPNNTYDYTFEIWNRTTNS